MVSRSVNWLKQTLLSTIALTILIAHSGSAASDDPEPALLSVATVRESSRAEMDDLNEIRVRGSVTFINNNWKVLAIYQDGKSIKVGFDADLPVSVGSLVEINGQVVLGDVGPVIVAKNVQVLSEKDLGEEFNPIPLTIDQNTAFSVDLIDQWVEFEGPAYSAVADDNYHYVSLAGQQFGVYAIIPNSTDLPPLGILREARIRVRGIPSISMQPGAEGQIDFLIPNSSFVEVVKTADAAADLNPRKIAEIGRVDMRGTSELPARIRAIVRCVNQSKRLFVSDETGALMVETHPDISIDQLAVGDVIEVEGRVVRNSEHKFVTDAMVRYVGKGFSLHPEHVTAAEAFERISQLIELDGTLVSGSDDTSGLLVKNGVSSFRVRADREMSQKLSKWSAGSRLRFTGCSWVSEGLDVDFDFYPASVSVVFGIPSDGSAEEPTSSAPSETRAATSAVGPGEPEGSITDRRPPFPGHPPFFLRPPVVITLQIALITLAGTIVWLIYGRLKVQEKFHKSIHEQLGNLSHIARLNALSEMVGALAHELNQPLASVSNYAATAELLSKKVPVDPEKLSGILTSIGREAFRASEIIRRLRHLVRKKTPGSLPIQISEIISETVELFKTQRVTANGVVEVDVPDNLPAVQADPVQIQQVLLNLLLNARDATEAQTHRPPTIRINAALDEGMVSVAVSDNGIGIANSNPDEIFEPYFTTREAGTGLGLAICRTIIETHGGKITADNNVSPDSTRITFTLPVARSQAVIAR